MTISKRVEHWYGLLNNNARSSLGACKGSTDHTYLLINYPAHSILVDLKGEGISFINQ